MGEKGKQNSQITYLVKSSYPQRPSLGGSHSLAQAFFFFMAQSLASSEFLASGLKKDFSCRAQVLLNLKISNTDREKC